MKNYALSILPFLFIAFVSSAQLEKNSTLYGTLRDKSSNEIIPFANLALYKGDTVLSAVISNLDGEYSFTNLSPGKYKLQAAYVGYSTQRINAIVLKAMDSLKLDVLLTNSGLKLQEIEIKSKGEEGVSGYSKRNHQISNSNAMYLRGGRMADLDEQNTEEYRHAEDNVYKDVLQDPLSTLSIDVDRASYSNVRRYIAQGKLPPADAVRVEEMINYFSYDYPLPSKDVPFSVSSEYAECPWNKKHNLVHIGIKGREIETNDLPPNNLVFLVDVSGSMMSHDKLPLLKSALYLLVEQLRDQDKVALVVYAGSAGLVLPSTSGKNKCKIIEAIDELTAGGSTAGGEGIELAYKTAVHNFIANGNNRVILATDGDFNVGVSSDAALAKLIEKNRNQGVYLTVLGFGTGNYKDSKMEQLADKGNGNYAYIDNLLEAKKVLVQEMGATLLTIANDVKIQVEFNPAIVKSYRLVGYENRLLNKEDFNDDKKDAGELGAGHCVTALYEIVPAGSGEETTAVEPLKYQTVVPPSKGTFTNEVLTLKLRYKRPGENESRLITKTMSDVKLKREKVSGNCLFACSVAGFGMLLRNSQFKGDANYKDILTMAKEARGKDDEGYRAEFIRLVETAALLSHRGE